MRFIPNLILRMFLCIPALASAPAWSQDAGETGAAVRAVVFYAPDTPQSRDLFAYFLPALFERNGARLEVSGIDVGQTAGAAAYRAAADGLGLPAETDGTPTAVVGERSMVGLMAIAETLGDNFEEVARDPSATVWPAIPELEQLLPGGIEDVKARVAREGVPTVVDGPSPSSSARSASDRFANVLAVVVLAGMVLALAHSLVRLRRTVGKPCRVSPWILPIILLVGFGISGYTAYTALAEAAPMCGPVGDCAAVQNSEYAKLFGIPMGVLGLIGYSIILVTWLMARQFSPKGGGWHWLPWAIALFGVLFSLRLTALGPFVIGATCLWCLGSAVSITTTLWLLSGCTRTRDVAA